MIVHTFEQHSDDWYNIRLGKFTASHASTIATAGKGLETLCYDLAAEILTKHKKDTFQSAAMEQGNELEDQARTLFELETGSVNTVLDVMAHFSIRREEVNILLVNGFHQKPEFELKDGDVVSLFPAVGGG